MRDDVTTVWLVIAVGGGLIAYALYERALERRKRVQRALLLWIRKNGRLLQAMKIAFSGIGISALEASQKMEDALRRTQILMDSMHVGEERMKEIRATALDLAHTTVLPYEFWIEKLCDGIRVATWGDVLKSVETYQTSRIWIDPATWMDLKAYERKDESGEKTENI